MADRSVLVRLKANVDDFRNGMQQAGRATSDFGRQISGQGNATREQMETVGKSALVMSGGMVVGFGLAAKAAIDWESAWAGVTKTVDGSEEQMAQLEGDLRRLATTLPSTHAEIAGVAEAAGQLGIQREAVAGFTETMIALGETTNLTADEAATALAQMANIMQTSQSDVDRMASSLVALGNAGASTESEILAMSLRLAGAGQIIGATEADVMALANAMASVGIEAQLGGGVMSRILTQIYSAAKEGGEALEGFADVAGMSADDFAQSWETNPMMAVDAFVKGLARIDAEGGNVVGALDELNIKGTQDVSVLLRLSGAGDLLAESLALGAKSWEENTALATEAEKRYATTGAQMEILRNKATDLAISAGDALLPALNGVVGVLGDMMTGFAEMPGSMQAVGMGFAVVTTGALGVVGVVGTLAPKVEILKKALNSMGAGGQFASRNLGRMATGLGVAGVALAAYTWKMGENAKATAEAEERLRRFEDAIRSAGGDVGEGITQFLADGIQNTPEFAARMLDLGVSVEEVAQAISGSDAEWQMMRDRFIEAERAAGTSGFELELYGDALDHLRGQTLQAAENVDVTNEAIGSSGSAASGAAGPMGEFAEANDELATAAQDAADAQKALFDAMGQTIDLMLGGLDALAGWEAGLDNLAENAAESGTSLDITTEAGRRNHSMLSDLVRAGRERIQQMIEEGATTRDVANAQDLMVLQLGETMRQMGFNEDEARVYADTLAAIPSSVHTTIDIDIDTGRAQQAIDNLNRQLSGAISGSSRIGGIQARAMGGPVNAHEPYIVGERGTELMVPTAAGRVIPNRELAGVGGREVHVHLDGDFTGFGPADMPIVAELVARKVAWATAQGLN